MTGTNENTNGKVTWYDLIKDKLSVIIEVQKEGNRKLDNLTDKVNKLCITVAQHGENIASNKEAITDLKTKSNRNDVITGGAALIATILGALGLTRS